MAPLKRKIEDREPDDIDDYEQNHPQRGASAPFSTPTGPFISFSDLSPQWRADLDNTFFYIERLSVLPLSTLNWKLRERHSQHNCVLHRLFQIRRSFFDIVTDANALVGQEPYLSEFADEVNGIKKGLTYVTVRWGSFLKRNKLCNLQNGTWRYEVGLLANQMWERLGVVGELVEEVKEKREERQTEEFWEEKLKALLEQGQHRGPEIMRAAWDKYFNGRLECLNERREVVRRRRGSRHREHRDWVVLIEKIDTLFLDWIKWQNETGPGEIELRDGGRMAII